MEWMDQSPELCSIVVPCYNEAARLKIDRYLEFLSQNPPISILFVDDGSRDDTLSALEGIRERFPRKVQVLHKTVNQGKAEAVREGMRHAIAAGNSSYVGFWDADLATGLDSIFELLQVLIGDPQLQMVFGARVRLLGREVHRRATRHYLGRVFATMVSVLFHLPIYDTQCGAKIFRITPELTAVLDRPFLSRWVFDVEILARFLALHRRDTVYAHHAIYEFPLKRWRDVAGSRVRPVDFVRAFGDLMRIYREYRMEAPGSRASAANAFPIGS